MTPRNYIVLAGSQGQIGDPDGSPISSSIVVYTHNVPTISEVLLTQPSVGSEWTYTVPASTWVRLAGGAVRVSTSSAVATRFMGVIVKDAAANTVGQFSPGGIGYTASVSNGRLSYVRTDRWIQAGNSVFGVTYSTIGCSPLILQPGWTLGSNTVGLQAGDQFSAVRLWFQTWTSQPIPDMPGPML